VGKFVAYLVFLATLAIGAAWYSTDGFGLSFVSRRGSIRDTDSQVLDDLYSHNPREAQQAEARVSRLGERVLPVLRAALTSGNGDPDRRKAALKACALLEQKAAPMVAEVAAQMHDPQLTEEAAVALSFMGPAAFGPLRSALTSPNAVIRREAIRSLGKLKARAPLDASAVTPLLLQAMHDEDHSVRTVAATYIGIIHEQPLESVPALVAGLDDPDIEVRRASATALGSFGEEAEPALTALRRAAGDRDPELAREAGRSLIRLQPSRR
jgi:HEAT repeat protein